MGGAKLQRCRIRAHVIRYKVYKDHDLLVDEVHFPEGGKTPISPQLDFSCTNQERFGIQRFRLHRNTRFLGRKSVGGFLYQYLIFVEIFYKRYVCSFYGANQSVCKQIQISNSIKQFQTVSYKQYQISIQMRVRF